MNITSMKQTPGISTASQSSQDSHEINIEKQIVNLQEQMRGITYDSQMSAEEKSDEKKALQEKIQSLNSELKQYQIQKRQEEAEKRQKETARKQEEAEKKALENTAKANSPDDTSNSSSEKTDSIDAGTQANIPESSLGNAHADTMVSISNTKEHLSHMQKIRTNLEGQLRTASSDEEKAGLQKKINNVSKNMGKKMRNIADTIADTQKEDKARKEKVQKQLQEYRDRTKNVSASVPKSTSASSTGSGYWKDSSAMPGKVFLTRIKP